MKPVLAVLAMIALGCLTLAALLQALRMLLALRDASRLASGYDAERTRLRDERDRLFNHLREIRFDRETGKLDAADCAHLSDRYAAEAAVVIDALDALDAEQAVRHEVRA